MALDVFADGDTQRAASDSYRVKFEHGRFDAVDFERVIKQIGSFNNSQQAIDFVYGSGFEAAPELLPIAANYFRLLGNQAETLRQMKAPDTFFAWLQKLHIPHPEVSFLPLENATGWLQKAAGGSGGTHIDRARPGFAPSAEAYFQREVAGLPISFLFAADGRQIQVIGFNRQWLAPAAAMPYRYGGAVSHWPLPKSIQQQLICAAQKLTEAVGLRGLNSLDAMLQEEQLWVLEVNPRLSASFDLYAMNLEQTNLDQTNSGSLFDVHLNACHGELSHWQPVKQAKAHHIVYAPWRLQAPETTFWPEWVADLPLPNSLIPADHPVCTVLAVADDAEAARDLVLSRADALISMIKTQQRK